MVNIYKNYENILIKETFTTKQYTSSKSVLFDRIRNYIHTTKVFGTNNNGKVPNTKLGRRSHKFQGTERTRYTNSNKSESIDLLDLDCSDDSNSVIITNLCCSTESRNIKKDDILFSDINHEQIYDFNVNNKTNLDDGNFLSLSCTHSSSESSISEYCCNNKRLEICSNTEELVLKNDNYIDLDIEAERLSNYFSYLEHLDPKKHSKEIQIINNTLTVKKQSISCPSNIDASKDRRLINKNVTYSNNYFEKVNCQTIQNSINKEGKNNANNYAYDNDCNNNLYDDDILRKSDFELLKIISSENLKDNETNTDLDNYKESLIFNGEISVLHTILEDTMIDKINCILFESHVIVENDYYHNLILYQSYMELKSSEIFTKYNSYVDDIFDFEYNPIFDCNTSNINLKGGKLPLHKRLLKRLEQKIFTSNHGRKKSRSSLASDTYQSKLVQSWHFKDESLSNSSSQLIFMPSFTRFTANANMSSSLNVGDNNNDLVFCDDMIIDRGRVVVNNFFSDKNRDRKESDIDPRVSIDKPKVIASHLLKNKSILPNFDSSIAICSKKDYLQLPDDTKDSIEKEDAIRQTFSSSDERVYNDMMGDDSSKLSKTLNDINTLVSSTSKCSATKKVIENAFVTAKPPKLLMNEREIADRLKNARMSQMYNVGDNVSDNLLMQMNMGRSMNYEFSVNGCTLTNNKFGSTSAICNTNTSQRTQKKPDKMNQTNNKSKVKKGRYICIPYCQPAKKTNTKTNCKPVPRQPHSKDFQNCFYHSVYNKSKYDDQYDNWDPQQDQEERVLHFNTRLNSSKNTLNDDMMMNENEMSHLSTLHLSQQDHDKKRVKLAEVRIPEYGKSLDREDMFTLDNTTSLTGKLHNAIDFNETESSFNTKDQHLYEEQLKKTQSDEKETLYTRNAKNKIVRDEVMQTADESSSQNGLVTFQRDTADGEDGMGLSKDSFFNSVYSDEKKRSSYKFCNSDQVCLEYEKKRNSYKFCNSDQVCINENKKITDKLNKAVKMMDNDMARESNKFRNSDIMNNIDMMSNPDKFRNSERLSNPDNFRNIERLSNPDIFRSNDRISNHSDNFRNNDRMSNHSDNFRNNDRMSIHSDNFRNNDMMNNIDKFKCAEILEQYLNGGKLKSYDDDGPMEQFKNSGTTMENDQLRNNDKMSSTDQVFQNYSPQKRSLRSSTGVDRNIHFENKIELNLSPKELDRLKNIRQESFRDNSDNIKLASEKISKGIAEYIFIQSVDLILCCCTMMWKPNLQNIETRTSKNSKQECIPVHDIMQYLAAMNRCGSNSSDNDYSNFCCNICKKWIPLQMKDEHEKWCIENLEMLNKEADAKRQEKKEQTSKKVRSMPGTICYLCGRYFTRHSVWIHESACREKWQRRNNQLPPEDQRSSVPTRPVISMDLVRSRVAEEIGRGNLNYKSQDAINELLYRESLRNQI